MNELLEQYTLAVEFPHVSGAEHLEMLHQRDKLFEMEATLSDNEKDALATADQQLVKQAPQFHAALSQFIDFEQRRRSQQIPPTRWWWYLDVLTHLLTSTQKIQPSSFNYQILHDR